MPLLFAPYEAMRFCTVALDLSGIRGVTVALDLSGIRGVSSALSIHNGAYGV